MISNGQHHPRRWRAPGFRVFRSEVSSVVANDRVGHGNPPSWNRPWGRQAAAGKTCSTSVLRLDGLSCSSQTQPERAISSSAVMQARSEISIPSPSAPCAFSNTWYHVARLLKNAWGKTTGQDTSPERYPTNASARSHPERGQFRRMAIIIAASAMISGSMPSSVAFSSRRMLYIRVPRLDNAGVLVNDARVR